MDDQNPTYDTDLDNKPIYDTDLGKEEGDKNKNPAKEKAQEMLKEGAKKGGKKAFKKARGEVEKKFGKKAAEEAAKQSAKAGGQAAGSGGAGGAGAAGTTAEAATAAEATEGAMGVGGGAAGTGGVAAGTGGVAAGVGGTAAGAGGAAAGAGAAGATGGAVGGGIAAGGWVVIIIILIVIIIIIVVIIIINLLGGNNLPKCTGGLSSSSNTASAAEPAILTVDGCPDGVTYTWGETDSTTLGGSFSPQGAPSTAYTPPFVSADTSVTIGVVVCSSSGPQCIPYVITLTVKSPTCAAYKGTCMSPDQASRVCNSANDLQKVQAVCPTTGDTCCKSTTPTVHFYCQYYKPGRTDCSLSSSGLSKTCTNGSCNGITTCDMVHSGCGPTSVAMILSSFGSVSQDPRTVALSNSSLLSLPSSDIPGNGCTCGGSYIGNFANYINRLGYKFVKINLVHIVSWDHDELNTFNTAGARNYLAQGCLLLAANNMRYSEGGTSRCSAGGPGGHATVISDVDAAGNVTDYDPTCCTSDTNFKTRTFSATDKNAVPGWWYVYPVCPK